MTARLPSLLSSPRNAYLALPGAVRGGLLIVIATMTLSSMQGCVRYVGSGMHPFEIGFFRSLFGCLVFVPLFVRYGLKPLHTRHLGANAFRGVMHVVSMLSFFLALTMIPMSKAVALDFSGPLFAALVAMAALGERFRVRRISALVFGYAGVLVVVRPGFIAIDTGVLLAILSAASWGLAMVAIKIAARGDDSLTITLYMVLFSIPLTLLASLPVWTTPTPVELAWLVLIGTLGSVGHVCIAQALRETEMTAVIPFDYLRMVWVSIIGYVVFAEVPDIWTWIGGAMIFSAATYISVRESRVAKERKKEVA